MEKFQNKYRIQSNRMQGWDYSGKGAYFITICTENHNCIFGYVEQGKMILNDFGKIAHYEWEISAQIRNEIELDTFVVMPNHLHGIVIINKSPQPPQPSQQQKPDHPKLYRKPKSISSFVGGYKSSVMTKINDLIDFFVETHGHFPVETHDHFPVETHGHFPVETHGRVSLTNSSSLPTKKYNKNNRLWQINYHDHIIRNVAEYNRIKTYIMENPKKWNKDKFYK